MADEPLTFTGAILTGGASRRMGRDKATEVLIDGQPLAQRLAGVLAAAGATEVISIGGRRDALAGLGLDARPDRHPGEGPLGGILTALLEAGEARVVVLACDLMALDEATVRALVGTLADPVVDVALARAEQLEPLIGAWRAARCLGPLGQAFAAGERAVHRAVAGLELRQVDAPMAVVRNANTLDDLPHG
jgi:molybdenum cofactor guanylyltransferase